MLWSLLLPPAWSENVESEGHGGDKLSLSEEKLHTKDFAPPPTIYFQAWIRLQLLNLSQLPMSN